MNVLLVRGDGIGDALACAPLVAALHAAGHSLGVVLGQQNSGIFASGAIAWVHTLERIPWPAHGSTSDSRRAALAQARRVGYDVALVASEEIDAYTFARDARIPTRVGFINGWEKPLKTVRTRPLLTRAIVRSASVHRARGHEASIIFALGAGLHDERFPTRDLSRLRPLVLESPAQRHVTERGVPSEHPVAARHNGVVEERRYVAVQVSRKCAAGGLDAAAYAALVHTLSADGQPVHLLGDDAAFVGDVVRRTEAARRGAFPDRPANHRNAWGDVTAEATPELAAWKACIANAAVLVTPDSGAAHVAGCVGVPCVDCFPAHSATVRDVARWHPWAAPYRAHVLDRTRSAEATAQQLCEAVRTLLAAPAPPAGTSRHASVAR